MNYVGLWKFHSVGTFDDNDQLIYLSADEYLNSPMPYIDETNDDAVQDEINERRKIIGMQVKICEDGKMYMLMPIPDGVSEDELRQAVDSGEVILVDGMMTDKPMSWEDRDGKLWYDTGIRGKILGEEADTWVKAIDENGYLNFINYRFEKI